MDLGLRGRAVFVAASSRGMGRAIAEQFAIEGADVGLCARRADELAEAEESVTAHGVRAVATVADVGVREQAHDAVDSTADKLGRLDALVINTGGPPKGRFEELDDDDWHTWFNNLFMSGVHLIHAALPRLRRSDAGAILFIASSTVKQQIPGLTLSNTIRGAVNGLSKTLANELAPQVRVNSLLPGAIRTDRQVELARAAGVTDIEGHFRGIGGRNPLGRIGEPNEVARVAVYLCSPAASFVTGAAVVVDGGQIQTVF